MTDNKQELIAQYRQWRADWEALVQQVGQERMDQPRPDGGWSFKDLMAHLGFYWGFEASRLEAALSDEPPAWWDEWWDADLEQKNLDIHNRNKDRPASAVLAAAAAACERVEAALNALPDEALFEVDRYPWMPGLALGPEVVAALHEHMYDDHAVDIEYWRAQT